MTSSRDSGAATVDMAGKENDPSHGQSWQVDGIPTSGHNFRVPKGTNLAMDQSNPNLTVNHYEPLQCKNHAGKTYDTSKHFRRFPDMDPQIIHWIFGFCLFFYMNHPAIGGIPHPISSHHIPGTPFHIQQCHLEEFVAEAGCCFRNLSSEFSAGCCLIKQCTSQIYIYIFSGFWIPYQTSPTISTFGHRLTSNLFTKNHIASHRHQRCTNGAALGSLFSAKCQVPFQPVRNFHKRHQ